MPIRIEPDQPQDERQPQRKKTSGGLGNLGRLLPFVLLFVFRKPKLLIPILIIGALLYFTGGLNFLLGDQTQNSEGGNLDDFFFGATLDQDRYDKAEVFEPLATSYGASTGLPRRVSLKPNAPKPLHQGRQGSCVGWASAYAARTILQSKATGANPNQQPFSPSFLYNQIALQGCQGAYMRDAMERMKQVGAVPFANFGYDQRTCQARPNNQHMQIASKYRIKGYNRLTVGANTYSPDIQGIKQHLAQGAPVVIGMQVGGSFMNGMRGREVWQASQRDYKLAGFSGHAMCVVGYDDSKAGGSFQIMNSWGTEWGKDGFAWVPYKDFQYFVKEAYGLYPMGNSPTYDSDKLAVEFGLVNPENRQMISLFDKGNGLFRTAKPIRKGDRFKVLIANSIECYVYVLGQETDGSSYVLFPYTSKHSPYCGITGTRVFPREESLVADQLGSQDKMAIVVSKKPLNVRALNDAINGSRQSSYEGKLFDALGRERISNVKFQAGQTISFSTSLGGANAVGMVLEIDKN